MKKNKKIVAVIAIILVIAMSFLGGQAYAKYVARVRGEGVAEIATWSFKVNGQKEQVQTINLVSTCDNETLVDNKIAPGTSGSFNIVVDGTGSDVGIDYNIEFTSDDTNKPANLKFIYENVEYDSITELESLLSGTINADDKDKTRTLEIGWQWAYETGSDNDEIASNDIIDTQDAETIANYTFNVVVSGTQVRPQA